MKFNLIDELNKNLSVAAHTWADHRLPKLVRFLLLILPLYLLAPLDLLPDGLPFGFVDDIVIFAVVVLLVKALVPARVIADARRAAALGMVILSVAGSCQSSYAEPAPLVLSSHCAVGGQGRPQKELCEQREHSNQTVRDVVQNHIALCDFFASTALALQHSARAIVLQSTHAIKPEGDDDLLSFVRKGGQTQLFGGASATAQSGELANNSLLCLPPYNKGGIFAFSEPISAELERC